MISVASDTESGIESGQYGTQLSRSEKEVRHVFTTRNILHLKPKMLPLIGGSLKEW